jgi:hypothetical protein
MLVVPRVEKVHFVDVKHAFVGSVDCARFDSVVRWGFHATRLERIVSYIAEERPESVAVASTNGGSSEESCLTRTFGILLSSPELSLPRMNMYPNMSKNPPNKRVMMSPD